MNTERLEAIVNRIKSNPACWHQSVWHCGTAHCVAGHAQIDSGKPVNDIATRRDARMWLDLSFSDADYLFNPDRTIADFESFLTLSPLDRDAVYRSGFDIHGFDSAGFDFDGFDIDGFDRSWFNRAGYDRAGYDRTGFNCDGLDKINEPESTL